MKLCERHSRLRCGECAYIEELKQDNQDLADKYNRDIYALESKLEEIQQTLEWYADEETYTYPDDGELITINALNYFDYGKLARQALKGDPNEPLTRNSNSR